MISRIVSAALAGMITSAILSFPNLGPASKSGPPMDLTAGPTPARIQFDQMLEAFNSGDRATIDRYREHDISPYWTHSPTTDMALNWFKQTGGYRVLRVRDVSPHYLVTLLRNVDSDDLFEMGVEVERDQPHRLMYLTLNYAADVPGEYWPQPLTDAEVSTELRKLLDRRVSAGKFSGAVLARHGDEVLFRGGFGLADRETGTPNTADTRFRIGQLSNMFTAVALLRLMQDGKLHLDDPVDRLLPELAGEDVGRASLGQLLSNSAGTDDIEHLGWRSDARRRRSLGDLVDEFGDADLLWKPGERFRYSSLGFVLLAAVVERVSGRGYADYVRDVVFKPAGMKATDFSGDTRGAGRAQSYRRPAGEQQWVSTGESFCCHGAPSSDAYSTVDDIARFLVALDARRLLDDPTTRLMLEKHIYMWGRAWQGYGLAVEVYDDGSPWITHEEGIEGQNGGFMFRPETGHLVVALGNYDAPTAIQVVRFAGARLPVVNRPVEINLAPP